MIIKLILLTTLVGAGAVLLRGRGTALRLLMRRVFSLATIAGGVVAVIFPDLLTRAAALVGVGRGTDLLLYLLCVAFLFVTIGLHLRLDEMHDKYVALARHVALIESDRDTRAPADATGTSRTYLTTTDLSGR